MFLTIKIYGPEMTDLLKVILRDGRPVYVQSPFLRLWIVNWLHTFSATYGKHLVNHPKKASKSSSASLPDSWFCGQISRKLPFNYLILTQCPALTHTAVQWALAPVTLETGWSWRFAWCTRFITAPTARAVSKSSARAWTTLDLASANLNHD